MLEFIKSIPGPDFLLIYPVFCVICFFVAWYFASDNSLKYNLPKLTRFNPVTIAYLDGVIPMLHAVIFGLWSRGLITLKEENNVPTLTTVGSAKEASGEIERELLSFFKSPKKLGDIKEIKSKVENILEPAYQDMQKAHLARTKSEMAYAHNIFMVAFAAVLGLGGIKLFLGISNDKPVAFLVIFMIIVGIFLIIKLVKSGKLHSNLGKKYQKAQQKHFEWVKDKVKNGKIPEGIDPAIPIALFGTSVLAGAFAFDAFYRPIRNTHSGSDGGGGCGGGCGGGGCGGGCGGCGG